MPSLTPTLIKLLGRLRVLWPDLHNVKASRKTSGGFFFYVPVYEFEKMNGDMTISVLALIKP